MSEIHKILNEVLSVVEIKTAKLGGIRVVVDSLKGIATLRSSLLHYAVRVNPDKNEVLIYPGTILQQKSWTEYKLWSDKKREGYISAYFYSFTSPTGVRLMAQAYTSGKNKSKIIIAYEPDDDYLVVVSR